MQLRLRFAAEFDRLFALWAPAALADPQSLRGRSQVAGQLRKESRYPSIRIPPNSLSLSATR